MKIIIFILLIGFTISCAAQKKIASLNDNTIVNVAAAKYSVTIKSDRITLQNTLNKLNNVKQVSPNLSPNIRLLEPPYGKQALAQLTEICADIITLNQLKELIKINNSSLFISIKTDLNGKPIELYFYTMANSILTLNQLEEIEKEIMNSFSITIKAYNAPFIKRSNFLTFDFNMYFENVLKLKKEKQNDKVEFPNIEFETALYLDLARDRAEQAAFVNSAIPASVKSAYADWLDTITNYNSKYPTTYADFNGQYFYFMGLFKQYSGYSDKGNIKIDLFPSTILNLFSTTNCR